MTFTQRQLEALYRQKLNAFSARALKELEPSTDYIHGWHQDCICEHLEAVWRGEIKRLIINQPPRTLKTHTTSISFPAWGFGQDPTIKFMLTSFKFELATKMTRKTRLIMQSEWYRNLYPDIAISDDQNQKHYFETTRRGHYYTSSMSSVTGEGADIIICFPKGTLVKTNKGDRCISDLQPSDKVLTFNHEKSIPEFKRIKKIYRRTGSRLLEVRTTDGNRVLCTPKHPFWVAGQGYKTAETIRVGDKVIQTRLQQDKKFMVYNELCLLLKRIQEAQGGLCQILEVCKHELFLLQCLLEETPKRQMSKKMCYLRKEDRDKIEEILSILQNKISESTSTIGLQQSVSIYQAINLVQRQLQLCRMSEQEKNNSPSYRREKKQQHATKSNHSLPDLPCEVTSGLCTGKVSSIKEFGCGKITVYDISVESNSNFFAEGILVHNCDDPLNPDEAASPVKRQNCIDTIRGTLFSRFNNDETGRFVMVMQRLNEDDPTGELLKDDGWYHLKLPAQAMEKSYSYSIGDNKWELKQGDLLFPARLSKEILQQKASELGAYNYAGQFLQEPKPIGGGEIKKDYLNYFTSQAFDAKPCNLYIIVDPAKGEENAIKNDNDFTAMVVWALAPDNNYYVIDGIKERLNPTERVDRLFELHRKWNAKTNKAPKVGYENIGLHGDLHYIRRKQDEENYRFPLQELPPKGVKKMAKIPQIRQLIPLFEQGRIWLPNDLYYKDYKGLPRNFINDIVEEEFLLFPFAPHDDFIDAMSLLLYMNPIFPKVTQSSYTNSYGNYNMSVLDI